MSLDDKLKSDNDAILMLVHTGNKTVAIAYLFALNKESVEYFVLLHRHMLGVAKTHDKMATVAELFGTAKCATLIEIGIPQPESPRQ